jgi:hypothetical protein
MGRAEPRQVGPNWQAPDTQLSAHAPDAGPQRLISLFRKALGANSCDPAKYRRQDSHSVTASRRMHCGT